MDFKKTVYTMAATRGKSISKLAEEIGKSPQTVSSTIKNGNPQKEFLIGIGKALGYDLAFIDPETSNIYKL